MDALFQLCLSQVPLNAFAYVARLLQINIVSPLSHLTLVCTWGGWTPQPMQSFVGGQYDNGGECGKREPRNLLGISNCNLESIHLMFACLFGLVITFCLRCQNQTIGLFKTRTFMAAWF